MARCRESGGKSIVEGLEVRHLHGRRLKRSVGKCLERHLTHSTIPEHTLNLCVTGRGERGRRVRGGGGG